MELEERIRLFLYGGMPVDLAAIVGKEIGAAIRKTPEQERKAHLVMLAAGYTARYVNMTDTPDDKVALWAADYAAEVLAAIEAQETGIPSVEAVDDPWIEVEIARAQLSAAVDALALIGGGSGGRRQANLALLEIREIRAKASGIDTLTGKPVAPAVGEGG